MNTPQTTSIEAYNFIKSSLGKRQEVVYKALEELKEANNLMISKKLNLPINQITPRVKELRDKKLVGVAFVAPDLYTLRNSIYWRCVR